MTLLDKFPENRFIALEEVQKLLRSKRFELFPFLATLTQADHAFVRYTFGNLSILFVVNDGASGCAHCADEDEATGSDRPSKTVVSIGLEIEKGDMETSATYQFTVEELNGICRAKKLKIESFGGS